MMQTMYNKGFSWFHVMSTRSKRRVWLIPIEVKYNLMRCNSLSSLVHKTLVLTLARN
jgi:hypothetical protein